MDTDNGYVLKVARVIRDTCIKYKWRGICVFSSLLLKDICKGYDIKTVQGYMCKGGKYIWHVWCEYNGERIDIGAAITRILVHRTVPIESEYYYELPHGVTPQHLLDSDEAAEHKIMAAIYEKYKDADNIEEYFAAAPQIVKTIRSEVLERVRTDKPIDKPTNTDTWTVIRMIEYDIASECADRLALKDSNIFSSLLLYTICKSKDVDMSIITDGFRVDNKQITPHMWCEYDGHIIDVSKKVWELKKVIMADDLDVLSVDYDSVKYTRDCTRSLSYKSKIKSMRSAIVSAAADTDKYWDRIPNAMIKIKNRVMTAAKTYGDIIETVPLSPSVKPKTDTYNLDAIDVWDLIGNIEEDIIVECISAGLIKGSATFASILLYTACRALGIDMKIVADGCKIDSYGRAMSHVWCEYLGVIIDPSKEIYERGIDTIRMLSGTFSGFCDQKITYVHSKKGSIAPHKVMDESMRKTVIKAVANVDAYWRNAPPLLLNIKQKIIAVSKIQYMKLYDAHSNELIY